MIKGYIIAQTELCKGCELCIDACPQDSLRLSPNLNKKGYRYIELYKDNCTGCTNCGIICPDSVITVYRENKKKKKQAEV
ncbi:MAG: hypothetical protein AMXMBFR48_16070 [Ignavibacteriales bacterium]|jgi:2-oxoglutarate ferredoxin oxidoreductase subunit delta